MAAANRRFYVWWQAKKTADSAKATQRVVEVMDGQTAILRDSVAAAQASADAAKMSAKAAMGVSVPTLMLNKFVFAPFGNDDLESKLRLPCVKIAVKNYGQTPAFLKSYAVEFTCEELPS